MPKKQTTNRKPKPARGPGKPRVDQRPVTPARLQQIGIMWLQGRNNCEIAKVIGLDESTVRYHLNTTIRPMWQEDMRSKLSEDLAKVAMMERIAWERFQSKAPGETIEQIEKALVGGRGRLRLVKQATRSVTRTGEAGWLQIIQWCLDFRARIHAHYAPTRHHVDVSGDLRVAGQSPDQVDQKMLDRLMSQIVERRKHQAALRIGQGGEGEGERN